MPSMINKFTSGNENSIFLRMLWVAETMALTTNGRFHNGCSHDLPAAFRTSVSERKTFAILGYAGMTITQAKSSSCRLCIKVGSYFRAIDHRFQKEQASEHASTFLPSILLSTAPAIDAHAGDTRPAGRLQAVKCRPGGGHRGQRKVTGDVADPVCHALQPQRARSAR